MMLRTVLQSNIAAIEVVDLGIIPDDGDELSVRLMSSFSTVDLLVSTGSVSMGSLDLMKPILEKMGKIHFGRLNMKPGRDRHTDTTEQIERGTAFKQRENSRFIFLLLLCACVCYR